MTGSTDRTESADESLVRAARAGDEAAFAELVATHLPMLRGFVARALDGHADGDDVVQETLVRALQGLPGLREPDRFRSWLLAIAQREVQAYRRRLATDPSRRPVPLVEPSDPAGDLAERTVAEILLAEQRRDVVAAARWLDEDDQRLLSLWWQETVGRLSRVELAAALSVSVRHASVRVLRMKTQLEAGRVMVRALRAVPRCPGLDELASGWDGVADPLWRKRLTRHIRDCPACLQHTRGLVALDDLLLSVAALSLAPGLAASATATGGAKSGVAWSTAQNYLSHKVVAAAAAITILAGGVLAYAVLERPAATDAAPVFVRPTASGQPFPPVSPTVPTAAVGSAGPTATAGTGVSAVPGTGVSTADVYVAPDGSDSGDGSIEQPYATLSKAASMVRAGQTIALRGGTYRPTEAVKIEVNGTARQRIVISSYRAERPVIDASGVPADQWTITQRADFVTVQGLEIKNSRSHAYVCRSCRYGIFQRLVIHDNARSSLMLRDDGTTGNRILDNDFFNNHDPAAAGSVGVGLAVTFGSGEGNLIRGNRAFDNADDGFDLGDFASPLTVEHNWSYGNGVNRWDVPNWRSNAIGFNLGGGDRQVTAAHLARHNAAWDNVSHGFDDGDDGGAMQLINNTAFRNGGAGFFVRAAPATLRDNASVDNVSPASLGATVTASGNSWQTGVDPGGLFRSTDPRTAQGPRTRNGALPPTRFLARSTGPGADMSGG